MDPTVRGLCACYNAVVIRSAFKTMHDLTLRHVGQGDLAFGLINKDYETFKSQLTPADRDTALHVFNYLTGMRGGTVTGNTSPMTPDVAATHAENIKTILINKPLEFKFPDLKVLDPSTDYVKMAMANVIQSVNAISRVLITELHMQRLDKFAVECGPWFIPIRGAAAGKPLGAQDAVNATGAAPTPPNGAGWGWSTSQSNPIPVNGAQVGGTNQHPTKPTNGGVSGHDTVRSNFNHLDVTRCVLSVLLALAVGLVFIVATLVALVETFTFGIIAIPTLVLKAILGGFNDSYDYFREGFVHNLRRYKMRYDQCCQIMVDAENRLRE